MTETKTILEELREHLPAKTKSTYGEGTKRKLFQITYPHAAGRKPINIAFVPDRDGPISDMLNDLTCQMGASHRSAALLTLAQEAIQEKGDDLKDLGTRLSTALGEQGHSRGLVAVIRRAHAQVTAHVDS